MNKFGLVLGALLLSTSSMTFAQMQNSIKINEVVTSNTAGLQDEYGRCGAWVEIANISHSTYNIRGMFLTTNRAVLNEEMSAPERMKLMSQIPNGDETTSLSGQQHIIYFANSLPANGAHHLTIQIDPTKETWVALYNGNGVNLIDSVTVPVLGENQSYARVVPNEPIWSIKNIDDVTPGISNNIGVTEGKVAKVKRQDPHGFGIALLCMGIVFFCLALLYAFFTLFGMFMKHRETAKKVASMQPLKAGVKTVEKTMEIGHKTNVILQDGLKTKGIDKEVYIAIISMALKQYQENVHDIESGVITIEPKHTEWNSEYNQITHFHE